MSQPSENIHFDSAQRIIAFPIHRIEEHAGSPGSGQQRKDPHHPPKQENTEEELLPQDVVEVSNDYQASHPTPLDTQNSHPLPHKTGGTPAAIAPPSPELHLDINT